MPSVTELEKAFHVYFDEIQRCRTAGTYWALLHVLVSLPDICAALEDSGWAKPEKYVGWCRRYCPTNDVLPAEAYREIRDIVLHQGRTVTPTGCYYKFTRPTITGARMHRCMLDGGAIVVIDVDALAEDIVSAIRLWFTDLQIPEAAARRDNVARNLPALVMAQNQEMPGIGGVTFTVTHTCTGNAFIRAM